MPNQTYSPACQVAVTGVYGEKLFSGSGASLGSGKTGKSEKKAEDPDAIVAELVNQYLRCSTTMSAIFRCW